MRHDIALLSLNELNKTVDGTNQDQYAGNVACKQNSSPVAGPEGAEMHLLLRFSGRVAEDLRVENQGRNKEGPKEDELDAETSDDNPLADCEAALRAAGHNTATYKDESLV